MERARKLQEERAKNAQQIEDVDYQVIPDEENSEEPAVSTKESQQD